jgi:hypothetical protein
MDEELFSMPFTVKAISFTLLLSSVIGFLIGTLLP